MLAYLTSASADVTRSFGITGVSSTIDSTVKDDIDNNGSTDTTKNLSNDIAYASIFVEWTNDSVGSGPLSMTFGIDLIPIEAELESRSTTQSSLKGAAAGAATTGTNSGAVDVFGHTTFYVQPGVTTANGITLFGTVGYVHAFADAEMKSVSSTDQTKSLDLTGIKLGLGVKKDLGDGRFFKVEYAETDYDDLSVTTDNSTKVTADIDNTTLALSIGKTF